MVSNRANDIGNEKYSELSTVGWTVDTLRQYMLKQHEDLKSLLSERYATQTKAVDAAFLAQQTAMQTALTAAERAVALALLSAEKAVTKAEIAADKRFESVNEFRQTLSDQAATFISRHEADARLQSLDEKLNVESVRTGTRITELELRITSRLDLVQGNANGTNQMMEAKRKDVAQLIAIAGVLLAFISIAVGVIISTR